MMFAVAGLLALVTGLVHSILGEVMIFRPLRNGSLISTTSSAPLAKRTIGILWATWHLVTVFGWAFAGILLQLAFAPQAASTTGLVVTAIVFANVGGGLLVLVGTKGRHPGWIALLAVAAFAWFGVNAA
ncbi:CHASE2 domain-containing sensor protein [Ensifer adhaerens]|uniref:CHASE2 domain-containing sensor protein n=1 Tax=Ensifer adhaerens TaxID=106592 RepID=A0ACC5T4N6_ENSAD|nr:hypothetical protein [Ensifer adhaerens]MBP1875861.1 CHASE2 domain-containing sensor protein [Ensifer adhaerens]